MSKNAFLAKNGLIKVDFCLDTHTNNNNSQLTIISVMNYMLTFFSIFISRCLQFPWWFREDAAYEYFDAAQKMRESSIFV